MQTQTIRLTSRWNPDNAMQKHLLALGLAALAACPVLATAASSNAPAPAYRFDSVAGFDGHFRIGPRADLDEVSAFGNWRLRRTPAGVGGGIDYSAADPDVLHVVGGNENRQGNVDFEIDVPAAGTIQFDWRYRSEDEDDCYDIGGYAVNGVFTEFACELGGAEALEGSASVPVAAGDRFAFRMYTADGQLGAGTLTVDKLRYVRAFRTFQASYEMGELGPSGFGFGLAFRNHGSTDIQWHLDDPVAAPPTDYVPLQAASAMQPVVRSAADCARFSGHAGAEPAGYAAHCWTPPMAPAPAARTAAGQPVRMAYALDVSYVSDDFLAHPVGNLAEADTIGENTHSLYALDFDAYGLRLFAIDDTTRQVGTIDLSTGAWVPHAALSGLPTGHTIGDLAIDPATGRAFLSSSDSNRSAVYALDLASGRATLLRTLDGIPSMIAMSIGPQGVLYGHDIGYDLIHALDPLTLEPAEIGPTGFDASWAQSMDFDNADGTLYANLYIDSGANVYGPVDLGTGQVAVLAQDDPPGEFEAATRTTLGGGPVCLDPSAAPWIEVRKTSGSLAPGAQDFVHVLLEPLLLPPGGHAANLCFQDGPPGSPPVIVRLEFSVSSCLFGSGFEEDDDYPKCRADR